MSTKTSIKRIALVAVSALGFGLLSVVPAKAAELYTTAITLTSSANPAAGSAVTVTVSGTTAAAGGGTDTWTLKGFILSKPANSTAPITTTAGADAADGTTFANTGSTTTLGVLIGSDDANGATATAKTFGTFAFTPSVAGSYTLRVFNDQSADGNVSPAEGFQDIVVAVGTAVSVLTELGNSATTTASAAANLVGLLVPTVGATVVEASGRVGQLVGFAPHYFIKRNAGHAGASADTNTAKANLNYSVTNPAGTAVSVVTAKVAGVASTEQNIQGDAGTITTTATTSTTTTTSTKGSVVYFNPATAGTYTITLFHDANGDDLVSPGEATATQTVVVAADAQPSITFTKYGSNPTPAQAAATKFGQVVKVSLRNGTTPWTLAGNETLTLTGPTGTVFDMKSSCTTTCSMVDASNGVSVDLVASNFNGSGDAWVNVGNTTAAGGIFTVTASIAGGTANGTSGSFSITTIDTSAAGYALVGNSTSSFTNANAGLGVSGTTIADGDAAKTWTVKPGVATTVSAKVATTTNAKLYTALVTDTLGLLTGIAGAQFNINATTALTGTVASATLSLAIPATTASLASGTTVAQFVIDKDTDATVTVQATSSAIDSVAVDPTDLATTTWSLRAAVASSNTFTATVYDQYGNAMASQAGTARVTAGRNAQALATNVITDANGQVTFKVTDTYTGTLLTSDTVAFTFGAQSGTVTVNYATYNAPSTVTITGGASADIAPTRTTNAINAGTSGASGSTVKMTATVKDANGATLPAGIPVTWEISGLTGTSAILVDATAGYDWSTSYTDGAGQAVTYVYAWGTGTVSVTAKAGAVTSATAGKINFVNAAGDARVVSATVNGNVITAKVVDRYGNPVKGVSLTATRNSGVGYFSGAASSSATGETNTLGTVDFIMAGGAANVTVATTTLNAGQTSSAAAQVNGTAITATSIGASLSPAGVQSVTVDVTAADPGQLAADAATAAAKAAEAAAKAAEAAAVAAAEKAAKDAVAAAEKAAKDAVAAAKAAQDAAVAEAQLAADAAAEAIDAANAATDAANLAAEAADAATVAAEEARDAADAATAAVEELSTQVATLMAALKAQITTLANTVAKIAKKVKA